MATKKKAPNENAAQRSITETVQQFATVKATLITAVDTVANTVAEQLAEVTATQALIDAKKAELKELHEIDAEAVRLQDLLEKRIARQQELTELDAIEQKHRDREEDQFKYDLSKKRRADDDLWLEDKKRREKAFQENNDLVLAGIELREEKVADAEKTIATLKVQLEENAKVADASEKRAVAIATSSLKKDLEHSFALERAKLSTDNQLLQAQVISLGSQLGSANAEVASLKEDLSEALNKVQSIAEKAIDGAAQAKVVVNSGDSQAANKR